MTSHCTIQSMTPSLSNKIKNQNRISLLKLNLPLLNITNKYSNLRSLSFIPFDNNATPVIQENDCTIYLGALEHSSNKEFLLKNNIQTIVCVTIDDPYFKNDPEMSHINFLHIPLLDSCTETIQDHFVSFSDFIEEQIKLKKSTLVHCHMGISRSATLMCSYLIAKKNMTSRESINFLRDKRPQIEPNVGFCFRLEDFEQVMKNSIIL
jgi:protein-tyrosine phosphatase